MTLYSYIVANDSGFAPNPFHGFCTLACCKPDIRKKARTGDYIVGLGPKRSGNHVVYAMLVGEIVEFDDYWHDKRFHIKRPHIEAGGDMAVGDNIYHRDKTGKWRQAPSCHSLNSGQQDWMHTSKDTNGQKVLIGRDFIYWGGDGPPLPDNLNGLIGGRAHRSTANAKYIPEFLEWFKGWKERGCLGMPTEELPKPSQPPYGKAGKAEFGRRKATQCR